MILFLMVWIRVLNSLFQPRKAKISTDYQDCICVGMTTVLGLEFYPFGDPWLISISRFPSGFVSVFRMEMRLDEYEVTKSPESPQPAIKWDTMEVPKALMKIKQHLRKW